MPPLSVTGSSSAAGNAGVPGEERVAVKCIHLSAGKELPGSQISVLSSHGSSAAV